MKGLGFINALKGQRTFVAIGTLLVCAIAATAFWPHNAVDSSLVAIVRRGALTAQLTTTGILRPIQSLTYHSPLVGRESEIIDLVPEGTRVNEGDLLVALGTTELLADLERGRQEQRQLQIDLQVADGEKQEAESAVKAASEGEGALVVEEARMRLQLTQKRVNLLRQEYEQMKPLLEKGFITRDELARTGQELDQAEEELALANRRTDVTVQVTHPREEQRAALQLAQRQAHLEDTRARLHDAEARLQALQDLIQSCKIYAQRPGLVVYEDFLNASPRRKIRVGDRVAFTQGLVTIPDVDRMQLEASVGEAEVHRVHPGQTAVVRVEAFPNARLTGRVVRVGTLASSSIDHPLDEKRFDLILELDSTTLDLRPEMTASADIVIDNLSDALLVPVNAVFDQRGAYVVHVVTGKQVETRRVELGESDSQFVEVTAGLRENERVMLSEPVQSAPSGEAEDGTFNRERTNGLEPR